MARNPENVRALDVELRRGDYNNRHEFEQALAGVETLLLVSGMDAPDKRIGQHRNVIAAAQAQNVKKMVISYKAQQTHGMSPWVLDNTPQVMTEETCDAHESNSIPKRHALG